MYKKLIIIFLLIVIILLFLGCSPKEGFFVFKDNGKKNKDNCKLFHYKLYQQCVNLSGGVDTDGNCMDRLKPNIIACDFTDY